MKIKMLGVVWLGFSNPSRAQIHAITQSEKMKAKPPSFPTGAIWAKNFLAMLQNRENQRILISIC